MTFRLFYDMIIRIPQVTTSVRSVRNALRLYAVHIRSKQSSAVEKVEVKIIQKAMHITDMMADTMKQKMPKGNEDVAEAPVSRTAATAVVTHRLLPPMRHEKRHRGTGLHSNRNCMSISESKSTGGKK